MKNVAAVLARPLRRARPRFKSPKKWVFRVGAIAQNMHFSNIFHVIAWLLAKVS